MHDTLAIITAHNEAERIGATLAALARAFPDTPLLVADDCSTDATAPIARAGGARVLDGEHALGKGGAATLAARHVLGQAGPHAGGEAALANANEQGAAAVGAEAVVLLCDGDLGESAARLA